MKLDATDRFLAVADPFVGAVVGVEKPILPSRRQCPIVNGVTIVGGIGVAGASRAEQDSLCCRAALTVLEAAGH